MGLTRYFPKAIAVLLLAAVFLSGGCTGKQPPSQDESINSSVSATGETNWTQGGDSKVKSSQAVSSAADDKVNPIKTGKGTTRAATKNRTYNSTALTTRTPAKPGVERDPIPGYPAVKEDVKLLKDAVVAYDLNDGGPSGQVKSPLAGGRSGTHKWGVWLQDSTFGKVLDFSTEGASLNVHANNLHLGSSFTVAAWVKAPVRENTSRVILAQGSTADGWQLRIDKDTKKLSFKAKGLSGSMDSGKVINDGKWHHVMVTYSGSKLTYYIDKAEVKSRSVTGSVPKVTGDVFIGSDAAGQNGLDGSLARVRIYNTVKTPDQVTEIQAPNSKNEMNTPLLTMKKGLVFDRRQYHGPVPPENEKVYPQDIQNGINMGFDHVKVLLTPNHIMNADGSLNTANMSYITRVVNDVVRLKINCLLCIHPEVPFKQTYLKEGANFEKLVKWYGELAAFIGNKWKANEVALQLMTEPYDNTPQTRWTWMSDRMVAAVRNVLPDHTIVTSSDTSGNMERLKLMSPMTDSNLVYSITTYEPYVIGFNNINGGTGGEETFWKYLSDVPYPANPNTLNAQKIEQVIEKVPAAMKEEARRCMQQFALGKLDGRVPSSYPDTYYDRNWNNRRMKSLDDWRRKYGGNIHMMCAEFGCLDSTTAQANYYAEAAGVSDETRLKIITDLRKAFEVYNIGWSYWSYNEVFTVFKTSKRAGGISPDTGAAMKWYDYDLLEKGLGLKPKK